MLALVMNYGEPPVPRSRTNSITEWQFMEDYEWNRKTAPVPLVLDTERYSSPPNGSFSYVESVRNYESEDDDWDEDGDFPEPYVVNGGPIQVANLEEEEEEDHYLINEIVPVVDRVPDDLRGNDWMDTFFCVHHELENDQFLLGNSDLMDLPEEARDLTLQSMGVFDLMMLASCGPEAREIVRQEGARRSAAEILIRLEEHEKQVTVKLGDREMKWDFRDNNNRNGNGFENYSIMNVNGKKLVWNKKYSRPDCVYIRTANIEKFAGVLVRELLYLFPNAGITNVVIDVSSSGNIEELFKIGGLDCQKLAVGGYYVYDPTAEMKTLLDNFRVSKTLALTTYPNDGFTHENISNVEHLIITMGHWVTGETLLALNNAKEINIRNDGRGHEYLLLLPRDFNAFIKKWLDGGCPELEHLRIELGYHYIDEKESAFNEGRRTILNGIRCLPRDVNRRATHYRKTRFRECPVDCREGWDIMRKDGKLATIIYGGTCSCNSCRDEPEFHLIVWHDRFQPAMVNTSRMTQFEIENEKHCFYEPPAYAFD